MEKIVLTTIFGIWLPLAMYAVKPLVADPATDAELNIMTVGEASLITLTTKNLKSIANSKRRTSEVLGSLIIVEETLLDSKKNKVQNILNISTIAILSGQIYEQADEMRRKIGKLQQKFPTDRISLAIMHTKMTDDLVEMTATIVAKLGTFAKKDGDKNLLNSKQRIEIMNDIIDDLKEFLCWLTKLNNKLDFLLATTVTTPSAEPEYTIPRIQIAQQVIENYKKLKF